jgi:hypothetical protein
MAATETGHTRFQATAWINFLCFTHRKDTHHKHTAHWPDRWSVLCAGLDAMVKGEISVPVANRISVFQCVASHYTDCFMRPHIYRYVFEMGYAKMSLMLKQHKAKAQTIIVKLFFFSRRYVYVTVTFVDKLGNVLITVCRRDDGNNQQVTVFLTVDQHEGLARYCDLH